MLCATATTASFREMLDGASELCYVARWFVDIQDTYIRHFAWGVAGAALHRTPNKIKCESAQSAVVESRCCRSSIAVPSLLSAPCPTEMMRRARKSSSVGSGAVREAMKAKCTMDTRPWCSEAEEPGPLRRALLQVAVRGCEGARETKRESGKDVCVFGCLQGRMRRARSRGRGWRR